jgi:hypothetical protein
MPCWFYGYSMFVNMARDGPSYPFVLIPTHGNQCGIVTGSHSPCRMKIDGLEPDMEACPLLRDIRLEDR